VVVLAALPGLTLLLRGTVWGSDSFAFWSVSCGQSQYAQMLSSPIWFVSAIQSIVDCSLLNLALITWFLYFLALLGIYFFAKKWFKDKAYLIPIYVACLTPLFFIEVLRFENDFFGWSLAFISLGLFALFLDKHKPQALFLSIVIACFSYILWSPSIFIMALSVFLLDIPILWSYLLLIPILGSQLLHKVGYAFGSFTQGIGVNAVSEEIPLVGLVFVLHVLHFYKKIPFPITWYGIFLILLGALKSKYMFLAVLPLLMGLLFKELESGLNLKKELFGIKEIPVLYCCFILMVGWFLMGLNMYPTQVDLNEMKQAIDIAVTEQLPLYNDWGEGWTFVSLGFDSNYKISPPNPDWNSLDRPFVAYSKTKILDCNAITKKIQYCF
jgi:hypothetical protein